MKKVMKKTVTLARRVHFSSAHRYFHPSYSEQQNKEVFGLCYTPYGHGHNYILEAYISGEIDPTSGMVINLRDVDRILKLVLEPLDHHHLNFDVPEFKTVVPTTENIAKYCFEKIEKEISSFSAKLEKVRLYEGEDLWVDYEANS
jgi:6-pyruvoyltetrahydropterin/6-carboxytetrahydropterin synthase